MLQCLNRFLLILIGLSRAPLSTLILITQVPWKGQSIWAKSWLIFIYFFPVKLQSLFQFQTTVSWGIKSTKYALFSQNARANFSSVESGELFVTLQASKYFPVSWTTSSDTAQYINVCASSLILECRNPPKILWINPCKAIKTGKISSIVDMKKTFMWLEKKSKFN